MRNECGSIRAKRDRPHGVRAVDANEEVENFLFKIDHFAQFAMRGAGGGDVRYWHKADIGLRGLNVYFGGKAGIGGTF